MHMKKEMCMWWLTSHISTVDEHEREKEKNKSLEKIKIGTYKIGMLVGNCVLDKWGERRWMKCK